MRRLQELGNESENWAAREAWLLKVIAELWTHRGLYPGLLRALEAAGAAPIVEGVKQVSEGEGHHRAHAMAFAVLDEGAENGLTIGLDAAARKKLSRNWKLLEDGARMLLRDVLSRFDFTAELMKTIVSDERSQNGLDVSAEAIRENPYVLAEMYCGDNPTDRIAWSAVDRGVLPSTS